MADGVRTILVAHPSPDLYGSDRMLVESCRALFPRWRVVVTLPGDGPLRRELEAVGASVRVLPVPVLRKSHASASGVLRLATQAVVALPRAIRLLRTERPVAVYVNTLTIPLWVAAARVLRVPVLCHVHEAEDHLPRPVRAALAAPLRLARLVLVNSAASATSLRASPLASKLPLRVVYNGVTGPPEPVGPPAPPGAPARLVLVGRLSPRKGTDVAVDAVALLQSRGHDVRLDLVGSVFPGYEWYELQCRELAERVAPGRVVFTGFRYDTWRALAAADVVLVPSRAEPFGNVAVEGMLASRPVVASDVQGLAEIVEHERTGLLVPPSDPAALADAVERMLLDWGLAEGIARHGRREAQRRFGMERYADAVRACVEGMLQQDSRTGPIPSS